MTYPSYMLDTNIASYIARDDKPAIRARMRSLVPGHICFSVLTKAELLHGLSRKPQATRLQENIFILLSKFDALAWDDAAAVAYATLRATLERRGKTIGIIDMLIAAHALSINAVLVTNDRDFRHVEGLTTEDWTLPPI